MSAPSLAADPIPADKPPASGPTGAGRPRRALPRTGLPAPPNGEGVRDDLFAALGDFDRCEADLFWFLTVSR
jgi:hypothetical protein